jgi:hypothetical protein
MKKVLKFSLVAVAALLFFVNVNLNLNGNKVEGAKLSTDIQTAQADGQCYMWSYNYACYCSSSTWYCIASCRPSGMCADIVVEH